MITYIPIFSSQASALEKSDVALVARVPEKELKVTVITDDDGTNSCASLSLLSVLQTLLLLMGLLIILKALMSQEYDISLRPFQNNLINIEP